MGRLVFGLVAELKILTLGRRAPTQPENASAKILCRAFVLAVFMSSHSESGMCSFAIRTGSPSSDGGESTLIERWSE